MENLEKLLRELIAEVKTTREYLGKIKQKGENPHRAF